MTRITGMRGALQAESSGWLFKSPYLQGAGHIVAAPIQAEQLFRWATSLLRADTQRCCRFSSATAILKFALIDFLL